MLTTKETDLLRAERDALAELAAVRERQTAEAQRDRDWCAAGERRVEESNERIHGALQDACYRSDLSSEGSTDKLIKRLVERSSELERELQQKRNRIDIDGGTIVQLTASAERLQRFADRFVKFVADQCGVAACEIGSDPGYALDLLIERLKTDEKAPVTSKHVEDDRMIHV